MDSHKTTIVYSASDPSGGMRKATRKRDKAPFLRARSCHHTFKGLSHSRVAVFLVLGITPLASAQPQLEVQLAPAAHIYDEAAPEGEMFVRHPWAIRDQQLERDKASQMEEVPSPVRNIITRDGVEFLFLLQNLLCLLGQRWVCTSEFSVRPSLFQRCEWRTGWLRGICRHHTIP